VETAVADDRLVAFAIADDRAPITADIDDRLSPAPASRFTLLADQRTGHLWRRAV
jgi:hypothetical protein